MNTISLSLSGNVTKDVSLERIRNFIKFEVMSMIGRGASVTTKQIEIEIIIKEKV
jgi:hypothetical protein